MSESKKNFYAVVMVFLLLVISGCGREAAISTPSTTEISVTPIPPNNRRLRIVDLEDVIPDFGGSFVSTIRNAIPSEAFREKTSFIFLKADKIQAKIEALEGFAPDRVVYPASTIKILVAVALLRKVDSGELTLDQRIVINQTNADQECFEACDRYGFGKVRTIDQLLWDMITVSSNLATNQLIDVVSKNDINLTAVVLGTPEVKLFRKVYANVDPEPGIHERNQATARGLAKIYLEIATGVQKVLSENSRAHLVEVLRNQVHNNRFSYHFPPNLIFYHKTGSTSQVSGDSGFFYGGLNHVFILVGLQGFRNFNYCVNRNCRTINGFQTLQEIGKSILDLLQIPHVEGQ